MIYHPVRKARVAKRIKKTLYKLNNLQLIADTGKIAGVGGNTFNSYM